MSTLREKLLAILADDSWAVFKFTPDVETLFPQEREALADRILALMKEGDAWKMME